MSFTYELKHNANEVRHEQQRVRSFGLLFILISTVCLVIMPFFTYNVFGATDHADQDVERTVTLEEMLQFALENSVYGKLAATQRDISLQQAMEAKAALQPHITVDGTVTRVRQKEENDPICIDLGIFGQELCLPTEFLDVDVKANAATLQLSLRGPVFPTQFVRATRTLGQLGQHVAQSGYDEALEQLTLQIVDAYYGLLQAQHAVKLLEHAVYVAKTELEEVEWQVSVGTASEVDMLQARSEVLQAQSQLAEAKGMEQSIRIALNQLVGYEPNTMVQLTLPQLPPPVIPSLHHALETAQQRPDIRQAYYMAEQAKANKYLVRAQEGLSFQLFGTMEKDNMEYTVGIDTTGFGQISIEGSEQWFDDSAPMSGTSEHWVVGIQASLPIADGGKRHAKMSEAELSAEAAQLQLETMLVTLESDLRRAEAEFLAAERSLEAARNAYDAMHEANQRMNEMYERGAVGKKEVLQLQTVTLKAEQDVLQAEHRYVQKRLQYMQQAGLLFEDWF